MSRMSMPSSVKVKLVEKVVVIEFNKELLILII